MEHPTADYYYRGAVQAPPRLYTSARLQSLVEKSEQDYQCFQLEPLVSELAPLHYGFRTTTHPGKAVNVEIGLTPRVESACVSTP